MSIINRKDRIMTDVETSIRNGENVLCFDSSIVNPNSRYHWDVINRLNEAGHSVSTSTHYVHTTGDVTTCYKLKYEGDSWFGRTVASIKSAVDYSNYFSS